MNTKFCEPHVGWSARKVCCRITSAPTKRSRALGENNARSVGGPRATETHLRGSLISGSILPKFLQVVGRLWRSWSVLQAGLLSRCCRLTPQMASFPARKTRQWRQQPRPSLRRAKTQPSGQSFRRPNRLASCSAPRQFRRWCQPSPGPS